MLALPRTLTEAIDDALVQRLDIRIAGSGIRQALATRTQADSQLRPQLDLVAEFLNTRRWDDYTGISASYEIPSVGPAAIEVTGSTPRYQLLPRLEVNYNLYAGGGQYASQRHALHQIQAAKLGLQAAMQQVVLDVARRYLALRASCLRLETTEAALRLAERVAQRQQRRHQRGELADLDQYQVQLSKLEKRQQRDLQRLAVKIAQARYATAIGHSVLKVQAPVSPAGGPPEDEFSDSAFYQAMCHFPRTLAIELETTMRLQQGGSMPTLARQRHEISAARERVSIEQAAERPQISLFAQYALAARRSHELGGVPDDIRRQQALVGLRLRLNLYDGGLRNARAEAAHAEVEHLSWLQQRDAQRIQEYLRENHFRQEQVGQTLTLAKSRLVLAGQQLALARKRFFAGRGSAQARQQAEQQWKEAHSTVALTKLEYARLQLEAHFVEAAVHSPPSGSLMNEDPGR